MRHMGRVGADCPTDGDEGLGTPGTRHEENLVLNQTYRGRKQDSKLAGKPHGGAGCATSLHQKRKTHDLIHTVGSTVCRLV